MENFNSQIAEAELKKATNKDLLIALIGKLIPALKLHEDNPDEATKILIGGKDSEIASLTTKLNLAIQEKEDAEQIATDAVNAASVINTTSKDLTLKVDKKTYKVAFGVDGLTKEELAEDTEKCKILVAKGSGALELVED